MPNPKGPAATTGRIELGVDKIDYLSQTHEDYPWPVGGGRQDSAAVAKMQATSSFVPGYDKPQYSSETKEKFVAPLNAETARPVAYKTDKTSVELGMEGPHFETTHRAGFPVHKVDVSALSQNKEATLEVNRAHFVFGTEPRVMDTTYREGVRAMHEAMQQQGAQTHSKTAGKALDRSAGSNNFAQSLFGTSAPSYETTNAMPLYDVKYERAKPFDPKSIAGMAATPGAAAVVATLTTSGKPLSAIAFGYDKPVYKTETMDRLHMDKIEYKQPYIPKLNPRYVKNHPALKPTSE